MKKSPNPLDPWITQKTGGMPLKEYHLQKVAETIAYAKAKSRFYGEHLKAYAIPESFTAFQNLPFLSAEDLILHGQQMICVPQHEIERIVTLFTSGTTGAPKRVYFTKEDQELTVDFFHHGMQCLVGKQDRVMILLPWKTPGSVGDLLHRGLLRIPCDSHRYGLIEDFRAAGRYIKEHEITSLVGNPVQVLRLAEISRMEGLNLQLSTVLLSTDYVPDALAKRLSSLLGCKVFEHYGMTEMCFGGGVYCSALAGYHLREADLYFEIIGEDGGALPAGEYGEIVFTTLTRTGMPLIRYRTGDYGSIRKERCACGSEHRLMEKVRGRMDGGVACKNGQSVTINDLDEVLFAIDGVTDYRISQNGNRFEIAICYAGEEPEVLRREVLQKAGEQIGKTVQVFVVREEGGPQGALQKRTIQSEKRKDSHETNN